jgi:hypothetical protein
MLGENSIVICITLPSYFASSITLSRKAIVPLPQGCYSAKCSPTFTAAVLLPFNKRFKLNQFCHHQG